MPEILKCKRCNKFFDKATRERRLLARPPCPLCGQTDNHIPAPSINNILQRNGLDATRDNIHVMDIKTGYQLFNTIRPGLHFKTFSSIPPTIVSQVGLDPDKRDEANFTGDTGQEVGFKLHSKVHYKFMFSFPTAEVDGFEFTENPNDNTIHRFLKGAGWLPSEPNEVKYQYVYSVPSFFPYVCRHPTGELGASEVMFPYVLEPSWVTSVWEVKCVQRPGNIEINQVAFLNTHS